MYSPLLPGSTVAYIRKHIMARGYDFLITHMRSSRFSTTDSFNFVLLNIISATKFVPSMRRYTYNAVDDASLMPSAIRVYNDCSADSC